MAWLQLLACTRCHVRKCTRSRLYIVSRRRRFSPRQYQWEQVLEIFPIRNVNAAIGAGLLHRGDRVRRYSNSEAMFAPLVRIRLETQHQGECSPKELRSSAEGGQRCGQRDTRASSSSRGSDVDIDVETVVDVAMDLQAATINAVEGAILLEHRFRQGVESQGCLQVFWRRSAIPWRRGGGGSCRSALIGVDGHVLSI